MARSKKWDLTATDIAGFLVSAEDHDAAPIQKMIWGNKDLRDLIEEQTGPNDVVAATMLGLGLEIGYKLGINKSRMRN